MSQVRHLIIVFGDQLNADASALDGFDLHQDAVWMAEVADEATQVWSHKQRIALFLSAMRHFRDALRKEGIRVEYAQIDDRKKTESFSGRLKIDFKRLRPERVIVTEPGEWRVLKELRKCCDEAGVELEVRVDRHFYTTVEDFRQHAEGRKQIRMEYFYREQRKRFGVLMDGDQPVGGDWNFDSANRDSFGSGGPQKHHSGPGIQPDELTQEVIQLVAERFANHPGSLDSFAWPVTPEMARSALKAFIKERLPDFGRYQDALWTREPWLNHSWLSAALNLKLLDPREVVEAAEAAYRKGTAPLQSVEGFIRQILGWREYVRGIYWTQMPDYLERNAMDASEPLPDFYWTGETEFTCLREVIGQTLEHGYAHHIQRLMVTGLYALLLGVRPKAVHEWYLAVYVDAVEWVELPNTLGMSQYADGGLMASKPYIASGKYIQKMSNYCRSCPRNPASRSGSDACPFTALYWDYLNRHRDVLSSNPRMRMQVKNLERLNSGGLSAVSRAANKIRNAPAGGSAFQLK